MGGGRGRDRGAHAFPWTVSHGPVLVSASRRWKLEGVIHPRGMLRLSSEHHAGSPPAHAEHHQDPAHWSPLAADEENTDVGAIPEDEGERRAGEARDADQGDCNSSDTPVVRPPARQRSHTYCGQAICQSMEREQQGSCHLERRHSNDVLWSHRKASSLWHDDTDGSSSTLGERRRSLSRRSSDESQKSPPAGCAVLRRALSSLGVRFLQDKERPVQRILRPVRRRQTVRGLSGLAIDTHNQWTSATPMNG